MPPGPKRRIGSERLLGEDHLRVAAAASRGMGREKLRTAFQRPVTQRYFDKVLRELEDGRVLVTRDGSVDWVDPAVQAAIRSRGLVLGGLRDSLALASDEGSVGVPWGIIVALHGLSGAEALERRALDELRAAVRAESLTAVEGLCRVAFATGRAELAVLAAELGFPFDPDAAWRDLRGLATPAIQARAFRNRRFLLFNETILAASPGPGPVERGRVGKRRPG